MKKIIFTTLFLLGCVSIVGAFEIDGFKSGMSIQEAQEVLKKYSYGNIKVQENSIFAEQYHDNRFISIGFCDGKLVQFQKELKPRFDYFTRLVDEKRNELGKPVDAWSLPTDVTSNVESNSITFLWKADDTIISVSYTEFPQNNQLSITYETYNTCWKIPY